MSAHRRSTPDSSATAKPTRTASAVRSRAEIAGLSQRPLAVDFLLQAQDRRARRTDLPVRFQNGIFTWTIGSKKGCDYRKGDLSDPARIGGASVHGKTCPTRAVLAFPAASGQAAFNRRQTAGPPSGQKFPPCRGSQNAPRLWQVLYRRRPWHVFATEQPALTHGEPPAGTFSGRQATSLRTVAGTWHRTQRPGRPGLPDDLRGAATPGNAA